MKRRKLWLIGAWIFTLINVGGGGFALAAGEVPHTAVHAVLAVVGVYLVVRLSRRSPHEDVAAVTAIDDRLDQIQQSVDAVALEVERIGEAQRFAAKLAAKRSESRLDEPPDTT
jgi:hypothetical protein